MENNIQDNAQIKEGYPVSFEVKYPEKSSRLLALFALMFFIPKTILLIPHLIILWFLGIVSFFIGMAGFLVILFIGRYPRTLFDILVGIFRWQMRVSAWMYSLTDKYPPFSFE